jgi:hypothetical protein
MKEFLKNLGDKAESALNRCDIGALEVWVA